MVNIQMASQETTIIPRVGDSPIVLELECTQEAMNRIGEIAVVNAATLPDLLGCFGKAMAELNRAMAIISLEIVKASSKVDKRKALILLEEMPQILLEKGLKGSEDIRAGILSLDDNYSQLKEQKEALEAVFDGLQRKIKTLELTLYSIKTIAQYKVMPRYNTDDFSNKEFSIGNAYSSER